MARPDEEEWQVPEKIPVAMLSSTGPTELAGSPVCWISRCISAAARQARSSCPSPAKKISNASPGT